MKRSSRSLVLVCLLSALAALLSVRPAVAESTAGLMATQGKFDVDDTGGTTYTVPVPVPSGPGGMQPSLSLTYSSRGGDGLLGMGWSLAGLSAITRCPATLEQDGFYDPGDYGSFDRFCLDGQRLFPLASTPNEYRTERDTFAKVTSSGTQGVGPASWTVKTKAGLTMEYGATADSRVEATGRTSVRVWALGKVTDTAGNAMTLTYWDDSANSGQYYLYSIVYGQNSILFEYESRPDPMKAYQYGSKIETIYRLKTIWTRWSNQIVRKTELGYDAAATSTARSRLASIRECGTDEATCLAPLSFAWTNTNLATWPTSWNLAGADGYYSNYGSEMGDFNGDGFVDVLWLRKRADGTVDGSYSMIFWQGYAGGFTNKYALPYATAGYDGYMAHVADFNGDGRADILWDQKLGDGRSWDQKSRILWWGQEAPGTFAGIVLAGTSGRFNQYRLIVGEFNGDGKADILWLRGVQVGGRVEDYPGAKHELWYGNGDGTFAQYTDLFTMFGTSAAHRYQETTAHVADFTGDGLADIYWERKQEDGRTEDWANGQATRDLWVNQGYGQPWEIWQQVLASPGANGSLQDYDLRVGDLNGDGTADLFYYWGNADGRRWIDSAHPSYVYFSKGGHTFDKLQNPAGQDTAADYVDRRPHYTDVNSDGITDILWVKEDSDGRTIANGNMHLWLGTTYNFTIQTSFGGVLGAGWSVSPMDLNGDGLVDLFWDKLDADGRTTGTRAAWFNQSQWTWAPPDVLTKVTDGLGASIEVGYAPITYNPVYAKDTAAVYPFVDFKSRIRSANRVSQRR